MRVLAWLPLVFAAPVLAAACGDDEASSDDLEEACERFCEASFSQPCGDIDFTAEQCKSQCGFLAAQLDGYCVGEYTAAFECLADGGFTCTNDVLTPNDPCIAESTAFTECQQEAACERFCDEVGGCGGGDCVSKCNADRASFETCSFQYDFLLQCYARESAGCAGSLPDASGCEEEVLGVGDCLSFDDACAGWCFAAERLGCGAGCAEDCAAKLADPTCGSAYGSLIDCGLFFEQAACSGGELLPLDCDFELEQYQTCASG